MTGFIASLNTEIHMTNCIISECINTLPAMNLFKLLDKCSIFIQKTNITHNSLFGCHGFLLAEVQEKVVISNCLYKNNSASGHFVVTGNSTLFISQSKNSSCAKNSEIVVNLQLILIRMSTENRLLDTSRLFWHVSSSFLI